MKRGPTLLAGLCAAALSAAAVVAAPDPLAEARMPFDALRLSTELARAGHAQHDAWSLAVAARIRKLTPVQAVARSPVGGAADRSARDDVDAWLAEAEDRGGDDPRVMSLVKEVRGLAFKGRNGGPQLSRARLGAGAAHRYGEQFQIGRPAVVYVEGDGDTDLTLVVRDPAGVPACIQGGPGDVKLCAWTAGRGGPYRVEVRNPGQVENAYALATN
jgi:hypothetical protein